MENKTLVIAGMHRSGTSLVTQWLYRCGLFIGDELEGAAIGNMEGHFEDRDFLQLHQQLLQKQGKPETGLITSALPALNAAALQEMEKLVAKRNNDHKEWGWKDPRTCLFLQAYSGLLTGAHYCIVVRDFNSTISSLVTREFKMQEKRFLTKKGLSKLKWILFKRKSLEKIVTTKTDQLLKVWINYYEHLLLLINALPENKYMLINYISLAVNDKAVFDQLKLHWQFTLEYFPFHKVYHPELISEVIDVKKYIKDKRLQKTAENIERLVHAKIMQHTKVVRMESFS